MIKLRLLKNTFLVVLFINLYKVVLTLSIVTFLSVTTQTKAFSIASLSFGVVNFSIFLKENWKLVLLQSFKVKLRILSCCPEHLHTKHNVICLNSLTSE